MPHAATAYITCRLVPAQDPRASLAADRGAPARALPAGRAAAGGRPPGAVPAYALAADHPAIAAACDALRAIYPGREPLLVRMGGTLPAAAMFEEVLGVQTLMFSFSTSDERLHAPNEFFRLHRASEGMRAWAELSSLLAGRAGTCRPGRAHSQTKE